MKQELFLGGLAERLSSHDGKVLHAKSGELHRTLDEHQHLAMWSIAEAIEAYRQKFSVVHACGTGKTVIAAELIHQAHIVEPSFQGKDLCIAVDRTNAGRLTDEFQGIGIDVGKWGDGKKQLDRATVVATIQTLQKNQEDFAALLGGTRLLIGDEADLLLTASRLKVIKNLNPVLQVGFTATPTWQDGRTITNEWGEIISHLPLLEALKQGKLVAPLWFLYLSKLNGDSLPIVQGDFEKKELAAAMRSIEIEKGIIEIYDALLAPEKKKETLALIYLPSVDLVEEVQKSLQQQYPHLTIHVWTGKDTTPTQRKLSEEACKTGNVHILLLCEMGGRALDLPNASILIDAYPTLSATKLEQRHARVLRQNRENPDEKLLATVVQIVTSGTRFRSLCLPDLLGEDTWEKAERGELLVSPNTQDTSGAPRSEVVQKIRSQLMSAGEQNVHVRLLRRFDGFKQLDIERKFTKTWDERYTDLEEFYVSHSNQLPLASSTDESERSLAGWLNIQKMAWRDGKLNDEQIAKLTKLDQQPADKLKTWDERYTDLEEFRTNHSNQLPSKMSEDETERSLAGWIAVQKIAWRDGKLNDEQITKLTKMGVVQAEKFEGIVKNWDKGYADLEEFYVSHSNQLPLASSTDESEKSIAAWLARQKIFWRDGKLKDEQIAKLTKLDLQPADKLKTWDERYTDLEEFRTNHSNQLPLASSTDESERSLAGWLNIQKMAWRDGKLNNEQIQKFLKLGIKKGEKFEYVKKTKNQRYEELQKFYTSHLNQLPLASSTDESERSIAGWLAVQKIAWRDGKLNNEQITKLTKMGVVQAEKIKNWDERYSDLEAFRTQNSDQWPSGRSGDANERSLRGWLAQQKEALRKGQLNDEQIAKLTKLGVKPAKSSED